MISVLSLVANEAPCQSPLSIRKSTRQVATNSPRCVMTKTSVCPSTRFFRIISPTSRVAKQCVILHLTSREQTRQVATKFRRMVLRWKPKFVSKLPAVEWSVRLCYRRLGKHHIAVPKEMSITKVNIIEQKSLDLLISSDEPPDISQSIGLSPFVNTVQYEKIMIPLYRAKTCPAVRKLMHCIPSLKRWAYHKTLFAESNKIRLENHRVAIARQHMWPLTKWWLL